MKHTETKAETELKRPRVNVFLGYPLFDEVERAADAEAVRGPAAFVLEVFRYGFQMYREMGSLRALKDLGRTRAAVPSRRISAETYEQLMAAVRIILERTPSTVIEELVRYAMSRAGKYGEPKTKEE